MLTPESITCCSTIYPVTAYGAQGGGVVDDTLEVQAAVNACEAAGHSQVMFPYAVGGYLVTALTLADTTQLIGPSVPADIAGGAPRIHLTPYTGHATAYTLIPSEHGGIFSNEGASGVMPYTLPPDPVAGLEYTVTNAMAGNDVTVTPAATHTLVVNGTAGAAGQGVSTGMAPGQVALFLAVSTTQWLVIDYTGSWSLI